MIIEAFDQMLAYLPHLFMEQEKVTKISPDFTELTGFPEGEATGKSIDYVFYDLLDINRNLFDIRHDQSKDSIYLFTKDKEPRQVNLIACPYTKTGCRVCIFIEKPNTRIDNGIPVINKLLERITDGFYALDKAWRFVYVNRQAEPFMNGKKKEELLGRIFWEIFPEVVGGILYQQYHRAMTEMIPVDFEVKSVYRTENWYHIHCYPAEEGLSVLMQDITARKSVEEVNRRLAMLVENSDDAILTVNPEGIITSWNKGAAKIYGYTAPEIIGEHINKLSAPDSQEQKQEIISLGENLGLNLVHARKDGTLIHVSSKVSFVKDSRENITELFAIYHDISERVKIEQALASERELLIVTLNSIGEGVVAIDREERIMLINESAAKLTGYFQQEAVGEPLQKILYLKKESRENGFFTKVASQTVSDHQILITRDLREVAVSVNHSPIKDCDGRIIGAVIVFQDIIQKQKTELELLKTEKLESLGILAGGIAHDFNNILAAILSNVQLAVVKLEKNEDISKYLLSTVETTRKASDLTKQLLIFSKGGTPVAKDASLIELIKGTAKFILRGSKVKAEFAIPDDLWPAHVDEGQISQVIQNLVINAKQAMPAGGIVYIGASNIIVEPGTHLQAGKYVKITVKDQGAGISEENLKKIFDPFFTTKKDGTGLGLTTSYSIIHRHGGYIEVESREGNGASFIVYLPVSNTVLIEAEASKEIAVAGIGLRILLMDDEDAIRNSVGEMLNLCGYKVVLARDGAEAIMLYKQALDSRESFDIVIMDLTVPGGIGGQEAIANLCDIDPGIKAIVSSGYANDPILADYQKFGFCGVVSKPYRFDELLEILNKVMAEKK